MAINSSATGGSLPGTPIGYNPPLPVGSMPAQTGAAARPDSFAARSGKDQQQAKNKKYSHVILAISGALIIGGAALGWMLTRGRSASTPLKFSGSVAGGILGGIASEIVAESIAEVLLEGVFGCLGSF